MRRQMLTENKNKQTKIQEKLHQGLSDNRIIRDFMTMINMFKEKTEN